MKVKVNTGKKGRPTCIVDLRVTTFRGAPCIEIESPIDIHPVHADRPDDLDKSYEDIVTSLGLTKYELDERDSQTMWIWIK